MSSVILPYARFGAFVFLLILVPPPWIAAQTYTITELPPLPGDSYCGALALNENGQAAGYSEHSAVIWSSQGAPKNIHDLSASFSVAFALNDSGQAAGDILPIVANSGAFFWDGVSMQRLSPPLGEYIDEAYAMNNSGVVIGTGGVTTFGYRWQAGSFQPLGVLPGDDTARPLAINNYGISAGISRGPNGARPVIWSPLTAQIVPLPTAATGGTPWGISDLGVVVGEYYTSVGAMPFYWSSGLGAQTLPLPAGTNRGYAWSINSAGVIIGAADGRPVVWRKTASGIYEAALLETKLNNATGWSGLSLNAINDAGQITGDGSFNGSGRGFILTPGSDLALILRTDADRSGTTDFDSPGDATAPGRPFYFWTNDDHDASGGDVEKGVADSADDRILNPVLVNGSGESAAVVRDLEDFARLAFKLTPDLKAALDAGAKLRLEAAGAGTIHLFSTPSAGAETRYLTDEPFAVSLITDVTTDVTLPSTVNSNGLTLWENIETLIKASDWESGRLRFLWEGVTPGACILTLKLTQPDGTEIASDPVHLSLHPVRDYFERARALPQDGFPPPYSTNGDVPPMTWGLVYPQITTPADQQNVDLVWVHGWRLTEYERQNWAEMMFKRLWHGGYRGRLHAFTWPTYSGDDFILKAGPAGFFSFDRSEFRAWKSGVALDAYLRAVRNSHPGGRLALIAHSMGNIVTGEALRRGAPADLQIMMQAAVSAGCYDTRPELNDPTLLSREGIRPTPDLAVDFGYRGFLTNVTVPTINYYNTVDFALGLWFTNQLTKPDNPVGRGSYEWIDGVTGFYSGKNLLREVTDIHESLAFLARSRTLAVGQQPLTDYTPDGLPRGSFTGRLDLHAEPFGFTADAAEHSAEFNRPIQKRLLPFFIQIRRNITGEIQ